LAYYRRRIEEGANCSPFVSAAILQIAQEVFPLDPEDSGKQGELGRVRLLVVAAHEPAGKIMELCQKVTVVLTLDAPGDLTLRAREGVTALRRSRILRLATEARDQGGLLSYEDLAYRLLNCGVQLGTEVVLAADLRLVGDSGQQIENGLGLEVTKPISPSRTANATWRTSFRSEARPENIFRSLSNIDWFLLHMGGMAKTAWTCY
jgi:hypothetical protein